MPYIFIYIMPYMYIWQTDMAIDRFKCKHLYAIHRHTYVCTKLYMTDICVCVRQTYVLNV